MTILALPANDVMTAEMRLPAIYENAKAVFAECVKTDECWELTI